MLPRCRRSMHDLLVQRHPPYCIANRHTARCLPPKPRTPGLPRRGLLRVPAAPPRVLPRPKQERSPRRKVHRYIWVRSRSPSSCSLASLASLSAAAAARGDVVAAVAAAARVTATIAAPLGSNRTTCPTFRAASSAAGHFGHCLPPPLRSQPRRAPLRLPL